MEKQTGRGQSAPATLPPTPSVPLGSAVSSSFHFSGIGWRSLLDGAATVSAAGTEAACRGRLCVCGVAVARVRKKGKNGSLAVGLRRF